MKPERFNDKAHNMLTTLLDEYESYLVANGYCEPEEASDIVALEYIDAVGGIIQYATSYVECEEIAGAEIFLYRITKRHTAAFNRNLHLCAKQISTHTTLYFPNYLYVLRWAYLQRLSKIEDHTQVAWDGVVLLATASLPGVRSDVRRELRRRGATSERTLTRDATLNARIGKNGTLICRIKRISVLST